MTALVLSGMVGALTNEALTMWRTRYSRHCAHRNVRPIYGDEINHTPGYRRSICLECSTYLDGPVLERRDG